MRAGRTDFDQQIFEDPEPFSITINADDWFELEIRKARLKGNEEEVADLEAEWKKANSLPASPDDRDDEPVFRFLRKEH